MKSSAVLPSLLVLLSSAEAATLPRSQHDQMLSRNFKNVAHRDLSRAPVQRRSPQGPRSNPGESTDIALSNLNPENTDSNGYVPQAMAGDAAQPTTTPSPTSTPASMSTFNPLVDMYTFTKSLGAPDISVPPYEYRRYHHSTGMPYPTGHHHRRPHPSGMPYPTGRHHRSHPSGMPYPTGGRHHHHPDEFVETDFDMEPNGQIDVHETLWQFNGTGWNSTNLPMPSGMAVGTLVPVPTGMMPAGATGSGGPSFEDGRVRTGFTGPAAHAMVEAEMMAQGGSGFDGEDGQETGAEGMGTGMKRWLSGIV